MSARGKRLSEACSILTALVMAASIQPQLARAQQSDPIPHPYEVAGEMVGGTLLALGGAVAFGVLGAITVGPQDGEDPGLLGAVIGATVGTTIGAASGVTLGGWAAGGNPLYHRALLGSMAGMGLFFFLAQPSLDPDYASFWIAWFGFPVAGAVVGTHWLRSVHRAGTTAGRVQALVTPSLDPIDRSVGIRGGVRVEF